VLAEIIFFLNLAILAYFVLLNASYTTLLVFSFLDILRYKRRSDSFDTEMILRSPLALPVSIVAPAFNEERTIVSNVRSLLNLTYNEYEVIVINDGSTDGTLEVLKKAFRLEPVHYAMRRELLTQPVRAVYRAPGIDRLTVIDKENGGKSDALNAGINASRYPLFCSIDADTLVNRDALLKVVVPFLEDPRHTIAAGGTVRTANGCTVEDGVVTRVGLGNAILPIFQTVEYLRAFLFGRIGWNLLGGNLIISGAFGVFRKDAVVAVGGYSPSTVGEDLELVIRLHRWHRANRVKYRIVFVPDPICFTEVPESLGDLGRQRDRWQRGLMESISMHWRMAFNPRYGRVGLLAFPYYIFFEMLSPIVEVFGYILVTLAFFAGIVDTPFLVMFFFVAMLYGVFLSVATVLLEEVSFAIYRSNTSLLWLCVFGVLENLGYRQLTVLWRLKGIVKFFFGAKGWGRHEQRRGFEPTPETAG
jgi:cellulose synthase/poly-beta-1,6-N-acetylglucosamine synthase-like glycosyltransferase